jgi:hypothetical protein
VSALRWLCGLEAEFSEHSKVVPGYVAATPFLKSLLWHCPTEGAIVVLAAYKKAVYSDDQSDAVGAKRSATRLSLQASRQRAPAKCIPVESLLS